MACAELQEDEAMALRAILGEEVFTSVKDTDGLIHGQLTIEAILPEAGILLVNEESDYRVTVNHLPPLLLNFELPESYPEKDIPRVEVMAHWMNDTLKFKVTKWLEDEAQSNLGEVILFRWHEMLLEDMFRHFVLNTLSVHERIIARRLHLHNAVTSGEDCQICFSILSMEEEDSSPKLAGECGHVFCKGCMRHYCQSRLADAGARAVVCPEPDCSQVMDHEQIRGLVPPEDFERYDRSLLDMSIRSLSSTSWCPRLQCQHPAQVGVSGNDHLGQCPACGFAFCTLCERAFHGDELCREDEVMCVKEQSKDSRELETLIDSLGVEKAREHLNRVVTDIFQSFNRRERVQLVDSYLQVML